MQNRMKAALRAWCEAYQKELIDDDPTPLQILMKKWIKDQFLAAYKLTVNDRFFDATQETTDGRPRGDYTIDPVAKTITYHSRQCATCRWREPGAGLMPCRRHAPTGIAKDGKTMLQWPYIWPFDWCGEWDR